MIESVLDFLSNLSDGRFLVVMIAISCVSVSVALVWLSFVYIKGNK